MYEPNCVAWFDFAVLWALLADWMLTLCILCLWSFILVLCCLLLLPLSASLEAKAVLFLSNLGQVVMIFMGFVLFLLNYYVSSQMLTCSGLTIGNKVLALVLGLRLQCMRNGGDSYSVGGIPAAPPQMVLVANGHSADWGWGLLTGVTGTQHNYGLSYMFMLPLMLSRALLILIFSK